MRRLVAFALVMAAHTAEAQRTADSASFTELRQDGNGVLALQRMVDIGFVDRPASMAFTTIADIARLNLTFDPQLPNLATRVHVAARNRTAAIALLEIAMLADIRITVSARGQIILAAVKPVLAQNHNASPDTVRSTPVNIPGLRVEASRDERLSFENATYASVTSLSGAALRSTPTFVEPDLLRSIQLLPGIEARSDWSAGFNVRGGEADQSLILLDGYPIYDPFHLGGVFSTFIDAAVGRVELFTGALPAQFGGRLSGVLDVHSAEPMSNDMHGVAQVSLVASTASLGRTFANGTASWSVAARRSYTDVVVDLVNPDGFPYHFEDVHAHLSAPIGGGVRLSATAYLGRDVATPARSDITNGGWGNDVIGATITKVIAPGASTFLGDTLAITQQFSLSRFSVGIRAYDILYDARNSVRDLRAGGALALHRKSAATTIGYELADLHTDYRTTTASAPLGDLLPINTFSQAQRSASAFVDHSWRPTSSLLFDFGGRIESVPEAHWSGASPRLSAKYFLGKDVAITAGGGRYAQWMHSLGREEEPVQPFQFWVASDSATPVSIMRDAVLGLERWITPSQLLHIGTFYKRYDRVSVPNQNDDAAIVGDEFTPTRGSSYGVDVLLRQIEGGSFSGWASYSYAFNKRIDSAGVWYFPAQDRRHNLNLVGSWKSDRYTFGMRMNLASGLPTTPVLGTFARNHYDPATQRWLVDQSTYSTQDILGARNSERLPWYSRIDVSLTRTGQYKGATVEPYVSIVNVLNSHNPAAFFYSTNRQFIDRASFPNLPFVPTVGINVKY